MADEISSVDLIDRYRKLRDKVKEIKERHAGELVLFNKAMEQLEAIALQQMQARGEKSIRTDEGTMYINTLTSFKLTDPVAFTEWAQQNNRLDMFERRVAKTVVEAYVDETNSLPPGVDRSALVSVNFRK